MHACTQQTFGSWSASDPQPSVHGAGNAKAKLLCHRHNAMHKLVGEKHLPRSWAAISDSWKRLKAKACIGKRIDGTSRRLEYIWPYVRVRYVAALRWAAPRIVLPDQTGTRPFLCALSICIFCVETQFSFCVLTCARLGVNHELTRTPIEKQRGTVDN
jgi:hypothetical protein